MKRTALMLIALIMLSSCSSYDPAQSFIDIRAEYLSGDVSLAAELTADYGDRVYDFELEYVGDGKSGEISVISPESISGISAQIDSDGHISLKCSDVLIDTGAVYSAGPTPVEALPLIVNAIREGYTSGIYSETIDGVEYLAVEIDETPAGAEQTILYTLWFSKEDNTLRKAEITADGFVAISAVFK